MIDKGRILLVDDEEDILEFLSYNLRKEGYKIKTASNGKSALKILEKFNPDLIILDVMMPEMDGIEVCENIRKNEKNDDVLILFLTARSEDYSELAGFSAGEADSAGMSLAYGVMLWIGAPIAFVAVVPILAGIVKAFTKS